MTLLKNRLSDKTPADMISDQYLLLEINKGKVVMDSWSMPWLTKKGHKVFLQAPLQVRAERVAKRSKISVSEARKTIRAKDNDTRKLFKRIYGFDIARDHEVFDQKIDTHTQSAREITKLLAATIRPA